MVYSKNFPPRLFARRTAGEVTLRSRENQLCAVASIPLPGLRRRSARARTRGQADRRAMIFSLLGVETTMDEL